MTVSLFFFFFFTYLKSLLVPKHSLRSSIPLKRELSWQLESLGVCVCAILPLCIIVGSFPRPRAYGEQDGGFWPAGLGPSGVLKRVLSEIDEGRDPHLPPPAPPCPPRGQILPVHPRTLSLARTLRVHGANPAAPLRSQSLSFF